MSNFSQNFKENSVAEFFKKNRQMLGLYGKIRSMTTIVHEFVTNSIDACEEVGILPDIEVKITELGTEYYEMHFVDNGPGIPESKVAKAIGKLLAGTKFHRNIQSRGQQGLGASGCVLFSQITTGQPTSIVSGVNGKKPIYMEITIDTIKNEPKIHIQKELDYEFRGLAIKAKYKDVLYNNSNQSPLEYLKRLAIANPHVKITFKEPNGKIHIFDRASQKIPNKPLEIIPHIKSIDVDTFLQNAKNSKQKNVVAYMKETYDRVSSKTLEDLETQIKDFSLKDLKIKNLDWDKSEKIVKTIKNIKTNAPRTDILIPIEEEHLKKSIVNILKPEALSVVSRKPAVYNGGFPFQIEVAIAYGGESGKNLKTYDNNKLDIIRFANKAPLLFDNGVCAITKSVNSIDWKRYNIKDLENIPMSIIVNISSVHIPYTSAGKQAIADIEDIMNEIRQALMQSARNISLHISRKRKLDLSEEKKKIFYKYANEIAHSISILVKKDEKEIKEKLKEIVSKKLAVEELEEKINKEKDEIDKYLEDSEPPKKKKKNLLDYVDGEDYE